MDDKIKELRNDSEKAKEYFMKHLAYTIEPVDLKNLTDEGKVNIVDARRNADYEISHIPAAISIPLEQLDTSLDKLDKNALTVVYSYNNECNLALKACLILAEYGYPCVYLKGGFKTWKEDFRFAST